MAYETLLVARDGATVEITINRPKALNALNRAVIEELSDALSAVADDATARAVIITGAGEKAFVAGADIAEMKDMDVDAAGQFSGRGHALGEQIAAMPQVVIAAVNGFALGGGSEVALAADIRLASENAVFAQPEVGLGIPPGWGATQRLTRLIGPGLAAELILSGRRVKADEALRIGLVNAVYPPGELMAAATKLASQIAANSPRAVAAAKRLMQLAFNGQIASGLETEVRLFGEGFGSEDQREGMGAFVEKRKPTFTGN